MKRYFFSCMYLIGFSLVATTCFGQADKSTRPSPPATTQGNINGADITVQYSSPAVRERMIWGELIPYGKVWRTGANEATVFETSKDIKVNGQKLPAGKYGLFTIPGEEEWTFIFNSVWEQWGAYKYDETKDVLRVNAKPELRTSFQERLNFQIEDNMLVLSWSTLQIGLLLK